MNQSDFSDLIESFLSNKFSDFKRTLKYHEDGSFDCELRNLSDEFSIWLATYNSEITLGLIAPDGNSNIHTHISLYNEEDIDDALYNLSARINEIIEDKVILYYSDQTGYGWTNDINLLFKRKKPFENIRAYSWRKELDIEE